jgi:ABC-type proline/glycine betaine transport system permease subunit
MRTEDQIDYSTLMPSKRRMLRAALFIAVPMLMIGLLLGLIVHNAPRSALAAALGEAFLAGGATAFIVPGSELLALKAGILWGAVLAFLVGPFIFIAWLLYHAKKEFNRLQDEQRMKEYRRIYGTKSSDQAINLKLPVK